MENNFDAKKYFESKLKNTVESGQEREVGMESITTGRLGILDRMISEIGPNNKYFYSIYNEHFLPDLTVLFDEFIQAKNRLDSNGKIKLYKKIEQESFDKKVEELAGIFKDELKTIKSVVEKIDKNVIKNEEKDEIESFLNYPDSIGQRLDKIKKLFGVLEKTGLNVQDFRNKISELEKIIEKQEFKKKEGELGNYY
ncbi:MAG: hypothetical protein M1155_00145 [Patescibacteria group bacterium]|nr:hypothetical protein [Patescibacteria group bacterium]